jgi:hypothetical protein
MESTKNTTETTLDAAGISAEYFLNELFAQEYCQECGKDLDEHVAVIGPTGLWFALCK